MRHSQTVTVDDRPSDCRCSEFADEPLSGNEAVGYCVEHLAQNGLHWEDESWRRAGYSCKWTGRYWFLDWNEGTSLLVPASYEAWVGAASQADNDFDYVVGEVFEIIDRGVLVDGRVERGSLRDGQTLTVIDQAGEIVTRATPDSWRSGAHRSGSASCTPRSPTQTPDWRRLTPSEVGASSGSVRAQPKSAEVPVSLASTRQADVLPVGGSVASAMSGRLQAFVPGWLLRERRFQLCADGQF